MDEATEFNFDDWAGDQNLDREITRALRAQHLDKWEQLVQITSDELLRVGLSVGQGVIVRQALISLGNKNMKTNIPASDGGSDDGTKDTETGSHAGANGGTVDSDCSDNEFEDSREQLPDTRPRLRNYAALDKQHCTGSGRVQGWP